jgi:hypothetical protein
MAEISRERDHTNARVGLRRRGKDLEGTISASVIHENHFVRSAGDPIQDRAQATEEFWKDVLLVQQGNRDGDPRNDFHDLLFPLNLVMPPLRAA